MSIFDTDNTDVDPDVDPTPEPAPKNTETKEETNVTDTVAIADKELFKFTIKGGTGHGAPWVVSEAISINQALELRDNHKTGLAAVVELAASLGGYLTKQSDDAGISVPNAGSGGSTGGGRGAAPQQSAPGGEVRTCAHGPMIYKTGVTEKNGKTWKAFMCPQPRGASDQCKAQFLN